MGLGGRAVRKPPSSVTPKSSRQSSAVRRPLSQVRSPQAPNAASHRVTAPDGQVIGADPDPGVRFELRRDAPYYTGDY
jgi:hypothetical protein